MWFVRNLHLLARPLAKNIPQNLRRTMLPVQVPTKGHIMTGLFRCSTCFRSLQQGLLPTHCELKGVRFRALPEREMLLPTSSHSNKLISGRPTDARLILFDRWIHCPRSWLPHGLLSERELSSNQPRISARESGYKGLVSMRYKVQSCMFQLHILSSRICCHGHLQTPT